MHAFTRSLVPPTPEQKWLAAQLDITQLLLESSHSGAALHRAILEALPRPLGILRATLVLVGGAPAPATRLDVPESGESEEPFAQTVEAIRNRVLQTGKPIVVEQLSRELLPGGTPVRGPVAQERSCVCVPLLMGKQCLGALTVELEFDKVREVELFVRNLRLVASLLLQTFRAHAGAGPQAQPANGAPPATNFSGIFVGTSPQTRQLLIQAGQVAKSASPVLVRGESGTGKALLAQAIHDNSPRAGKPFFRIRCSDASADQLEAELFGVDRGAGGGGSGPTRGRIELAEGGTVFLDEVGALPPPIQSRLLRLVQEGTFERVGGTTPVRVDVRLIAGSGRDLESALLAKSFREDLYYRLNVFTLFVAPLRERKADIRPLAEHFVTRYSRMHGKRVTSLSHEALELLSNQRWPGNVRELEAVIERSVLASDGEVLQVRHLPQALQAKEAPSGMERASLADAVEQFERSLLLEALKTTHGNCARAARMLDTTERIFHYKIRKYGLDPRQFK